MARIEGEIVIERPPAEVFDVVADECNEPRYDPRPLSVERLSPRPIGVGTRFRAETATRRGAAGMTIELTAYERQLRLASATRLSGMDIRGTLTFDPVPPGGSCAGGGTWEPHGLLGPAGPLVATAGRRRERRIWTGLERFLEARAATPSRHVTRPGRASCRRDRRRRGLPRPRQHLLRTEARGCADGMRGSR